MNVNYFCEKLENTHKHIGWHGVGEVITVALSILVNNPEFHNLSQISLITENMEHKANHIWLNIKIKIVIAI